MDHFTVVVVVVVVIDIAKEKLTSPLFDSLLPE